VRASASMNISGGYSVKKIGDMAEDHYFEKKYGKRPFGKQNHNFH